MNQCYFSAASRPTHVEKSVVEAAVVPELKSLPAPFLDCMRAVQLLNV